MTNPVIPGRANGSRECAPDDRLRASPESITTMGVYGFRVRAEEARPGMTG